MGNLKTLVLTCLGVGLAAGAGFYLYRKFTSANGDDQNTENSASQVTDEKENKQKVKQISLNHNLKQENEKS